MYRLIDNDTHGLACMAQTSAASAARRALRAKACMDEANTLKLHAGANQE